MKSIRYKAEAALVYVLFKIFSLLGPGKASALGGWIGKTIGPKLGASKKARSNIRASFPEKTEKECETILTGMWENLGRVIAEYPHLKTLAQSYVTVEGREFLPQRTQEKPLIFIGAHLANWEILHATFNYAIDWPLTSTYREPNNPDVAPLLQRCRDPDQKGRYIAKSTKGTREMVQAMRNNERMGFLIDQKNNQGLAISFFGRPAMTGPAFVQLAHKYQCPVYPVRVRRISGCHFEVRFYPELEIKGLDEIAALEKTHRMLEDWIREAPEQWLWLHRRWDSAALK